MHQHVFLSSLLLTALVSQGCTNSKESTGSGTPSAMGGASSAVGGSLSSGGGPSAGGNAAASLEAPDNAASLLPWLEAKNYENWAQEPEYHTSSGPHGDAVKVFYSPLAYESVLGKTTPMKLGSAVIKELTSGGSLYGWAVYVRGKEEPGTAGYFFYELIKPSSLYGDAYDSSECTGCHTAQSFLLSDANNIAPPAAP